MNRCSHTPRHPQSGFSLVEIMVAMTLGLVLLGGTIVIYASSKDSYRLQENIAGMQENARFAIHALRRDLEMAGYPREQNIAAFAPDQTIDGAGSDSDQLTIRLRSATDCLGSNTPVAGPDAGIAVNRYYIEDEQLMCQGNGNGTPQALVENIDNLQVLYGIDSDIDGSANLYVTASEVEAGVINAGTPDWDSVVSLRLAVLVASDTAIDRPVAAATSTDSASAPTTSNDFTLLDAPTITKDDGRLYRVFTATIPLRNRIL